MNRLKKVLLLVSTLFLLYGCASVLLVGAGAGLGVGSYMFVTGRLSVEYPMSYEQAWDATNRALEALQISISSSKNEPGKGSIEGVRQDGKKVNVTIKTTGYKITTIGVRVGTFGDRQDAQKIHDKIISFAGI